MCGRPRDRWARFIISWLGPNEAEKVRRSHFVSDYVDYSKFREGLFTLFGRLDFEDAYRQQLRVLVQSGAESVAAFASRTTDLSTRAYPDFPTDLQLDLAVDHFISGLSGASSRDYLRRERARRRISWQEAVQIAQASEVPRAVEYTASAAAASLDAMCAKTPNFAHSTMSFPNDCAMSAQIIPATQATRVVVAVPGNHAMLTRTRMRRPLAPRHSPIFSVHRRPDGPLTPATAPLYVHLLNCMCLNHSGISARTQGLRGHCRHASWHRTLISTRRSNK